VPEEEDKNKKVPEVKNNVCLGFRKLCCSKKIKKEAKEEERY
jgi:hypothetical protein